MSFLLNATRGDGTGLFRAGGSTEAAHTASPDSPNEMPPSSGTSRRRDRRRIHRKDPFNFETDSAVAFARRRREPRSVDLDLASSIRSDCSGRAQIVHQLRYRRSSHTEYLRQRLLGERQDVVIDAVAKLKQPACHAGFDRMQRIAGRAELKLRQHRADVN